MEGLQFTVLFLVTALNAINYANGIVKMFEVFFYGISVL